MHGAIVIEYIRKRMTELGFGDNYYLRLRHFALTGTDEVKLSLPGQLLVLMEPVTAVQITSDSGFYDLSTDTCNELQYEHTGNISMKNNGSELIVHVRFIQAIPF